jgi:hypothetical protein
MAYQLIQETLAVLSEKDRKRLARKGYIKMLAYAIRSRLFGPRRRTRHSIRSKRLQARYQR